MSVRRRAIRARVERDTTRKLQFDKMTRELTAIRDLCDRKIAAGEKSVTQAEINEAIQCAA